MQIPTVKVLVALSEQDGDPAVGAKIKATLSGTERYNGFIVPEEYNGVTDENGECIISLFPNELGSEGTEYRFKIVHRNGRTISVNASIPNSDCQLHQVSELGSYSLRGAGQVITEEVATYADSAYQSSLSASNSVDEASGYATQASQSASVAENHSNNAATSAQNASTSASQASSSVASVNNTVTTINTALASANSAKIAAEQARDASGVNKVEAIAAKDKAQLWADANENIVVESGKYSAKHHAAKALASASSALTQANNALTSANNSAQSANTALAHANDAKASKDQAAALTGDAILSKNSASLSASNASMSASTATSKADAAMVSATNAANSATSANSAKVSAEAARDLANTYKVLAKDWADKGVDLMVDGVGYSAKHHAIKASQSASLAQASAQEAVDTASNLENLIIAGTPSATTETAGVIRIATEQEIVTGENTTTAITPKALHDALVNVADGNTQIIDLTSISAVSPFVMEDNKEYVFHLPKYSGNPEDEEPYTSEIRKLVLPKAVTVNNTIKFSVIPYNGVHDLPVILEFTSFDLIQPIVESDIQLSETQTSVITNDKYTLTTTESYDGFSWSLSRLSSGDIVNKTFKGCSEYVHYAMFDDIDGTFDINFKNGNIQLIDIATPCTINIDMIEGNVIILQVSMFVNSLVDWTLADGSLIKWLGDTPPEFTLSNTDFVLLWKLGGIVFGKHIGSFTPSIPNLT